MLVLSACHDLHRCRNSRASQLAFLGSQNSQRICRVHSCTFFALRYGHAKASTRCCYGGSRTASSAAAPLLAQVPKSSSAISPCLPDTYLVLPLHMHLSPQCSASSSEGKLSSGILPVTAVRLAIWSLLDQLFVPYCAVCSALGEITKRFTQIQEKLHNNIEVPWQPSHPCFLQDAAFN